MALSKVVLEIWEEMEVEVDSVPELMLGDSRSPRDLVVPAAGPSGAASPSFSLSSRRWRVFSTWMKNGEGQRTRVLTQFVRKKRHLKTHLMQLFHFLQLPLVLRDEAVPSGPPAGQVLLTTDISH